MRIPTSLLLSLAPLLALVHAADPTRWAELSARSPNGIIPLDSASYDELLASDREYGVTVLLTALPPQFKCQPCHEFEPSFRQVAGSWRRLPQHVRDQHFFAELDFQDGQAVYQRLGLTSAPTVQFHPAQAGPNKSNKLSVVTYDLNRNGLRPEPFHSWTLPLTPVPFKLHVPTNPVPYIVAPMAILIGAASLYTLRPILVPALQSRIVWGLASIVLILTFTSGHMWNKIKNAPYVAAGEGGRVSWIAGGFQNQLGMESQVVGGLYGLLSFCIVALTVFVPGQSSPMKQRVGVYVWLGIFIVLFSLLVKLFKMKNGGYPYSLLF